MSDPGNTNYSNQTSIFEDVKEFHTEFKIPAVKPPFQLNYKALSFRIKFLWEEMEELETAIDEQNICDQIDALIDLIYVAAGTLDLMGVDGQRHFSLVHRANMKKVRAQKAGDSKRMSSFDVIKPKGWLAPDHSVLWKSYTRKPNDTNI
jgi:predicted HAD superfamily Cof-like phosphohydrolase